MKRVALFAAGLLLPLCAGCTRSCSKTPEAAETDAAAVDSAAGPVAAGDASSSSSSVGARLMELATGLRSPSSMVADKTTLFFADESEGAIKSVSKDGGNVSIVARGQDHPTSLAILKNEVYWVSPQNGAYRAPLATMGVYKASPVEVVRDGPFRWLAANDSEILLITSGEKPNAISRVTGPTIARIADIDETPSSFAADNQYAYLSTLVPPGRPGAPKLIRVPRLPGEKKVNTFGGTGFTHIKVNGDDVFAVGAVTGVDVPDELKAALPDASATKTLVGLFRIPEHGAGKPIYLAAAATEGVFAVTSDAVYFVDTMGVLRRVSRSTFTLRMTTISASPRLSGATAIVVDDRYAYVATTGKTWSLDAPVEEDGGGTPKGEIVKIRLDGTP